jgi:hypothetical protein
VCHPPDGHNDVVIRSLRPWAPLVSAREEAIMTCRVARSVQNHIPIDLVSCSECGSANLSIVSPSGLKCE